MFTCDQCAKLCQPLQAGCFGGKIGTILFISNFFFHLSLYLSPSFFLLLQVEYEKTSICIFLKIKFSLKHLLLFCCKDSQISFSGQNIWCELTNITMPTARVENSWKAIDSREYFQWILFQRIFSVNIDSSEYFLWVLVPVKLSHMHTLLLPNDKQNWVNCGKYLRD